MTGSEKKGYLFVFLTGVFFALEVLGFKSIFKNEKIFPILAAFIGVFGSFLLLTPFAFFNANHRERVMITIRRDGFALLLGTFFNSIGVSLYYFALSQSELGPSAILVKTTALFNVLFGIFFLKEAFTRKDALGLTLTFAGVYLIGSMGEGISFFSSFMILASALFFSTQSFLIKRFAPEIFGIEFAYLRMGLLSFFFAMALSFLKLWALPETELVFKLIGFAFLGFFLGRAFYFEAHKSLPIGKLNSVMLIEPVFLLLIGILFLNESLSWKKILGSFGILFGLYLLVFHTRAKNQKN